MNILRKKLEGSEKITGTLVSLTDPCLCEIAGNTGYNCVWIDTEHTYMSNKEVLCHLNAARSAGIPSVVRLPQNDPTETRKILEMGSDGIIFPMVRSAKEAEALIKSTLYPPYGTRGFGPMRAINYGATDANVYVNEKSLELCRFLQLEHTDAIDSLEEIVEIPYIDGFIFGPNDLSGSLGEPLKVFGDKCIAKIKYAIQVLKEHKKYIGLACGMNESDIKFWSGLEFDMLFAGSDWCFLYEQSRKTYNTLKKYFLEDT